MRKDTRKFRKKERTQTADDRSRLSQVALPDIGVKGREYLAQCGEKNQNCQLK